MSRAPRSPAILALFVATGLAAAAPLPATAPLPAWQQEMQGLQTGRSGPLEDSALEARATALAAELRCPVCQGLSIQDSPSPLAQDMKELIRSRLTAGASDEEVREYFVSRYGEWVLLEPRASGFNLLIYVLPALALLTGALVVVVAVRRWTAPDDEPVEAS